MDEYLLVTVRSKPGEAEEDFKARITAFWSHYLRAKPDDYEKVYAEHTDFDRNGDCLLRLYMVQSDGVATLTAELTAWGMAFDDVDSDDVYSKYEATPPEWFWIEH